jgi:cation diffusion facilitator CzcD-associated flavoprotein CzcO
MASSLGFAEMIMNATFVTMSIEVPPDRQVDVLVVGAGISGISAACHLLERCPTTRVALVERRARLGGTWDLFRYPGVRSDSDMHTLGFRFRPWIGDKAIADGADILRYLEDTARAHGVDDLVSYGRHVRSASWSSATATWTVGVDVAGGATERWEARYLWVCAGYYDYDQGYDPDIPGRDRFGGPILHPQHWPADFDATGQRVVVIGSGATAFTLVPALARTAAHVTMLQRSPTYVVSTPAVDGVARWLRDHLPSRAAYALTRWKNVAVSAATFLWARRFPRSTKRYLLAEVRKRLPADVDARIHFTPSYEPWDQRICVVPDDDFFDAVRSGAVTVVTDRIEAIDGTGIRLASGDHLECDVIVTATGLNLQMLGGAEFRVDGEALNTGELVTYKGCMYAGVPNLTVTLGYFTASWTLKADLTSQYTCRLLRYLDEHGYDTVVPRLDAAAAEQPADLTFAPGYVRRSAAIIPRQGVRRPWRLSEQYPLDALLLRHGAIDDGVLAFGHAGDARTATSPAAPVARSRRGRAPVTG